jgi:simple sugar transport system permease protein
MSETRTTESPEAPKAAAPAVVPVIEPPAERVRRLRVGGLMVVFALIGLGLAFATKGGKATFQLVSGDLQHNLFGVPAQPVAILLGVLGLAAAVAYVLRQVPTKYAGWLATILGISFIGAFLCWAAAGKTFPLANQFQGTLNFATPLILGALAGVLCERAGVINIAIEGQFLVGAFTAAVVSSTTGSGAAALIAAAASGVLMAVLLAIFSIKYLVNQVVLGVVLNVFALGVTGFVYDALMQPNQDSLNNPAIFSNIAIPVLSDIPVLGPLLFDANIIVYLTYVLIVVVDVALFRTRWGLRTRAVGEHPKAADTVGIKVLAMRYRNVVMGGAVAGLAGAYLTIGAVGAFSKNISSGKGFIALAAVIFGGWSPRAAIGAALLFGFSDALGTVLSFTSTPVTIPSNLLAMLPYLATLFAVAGLVGRVRAPAADGEPYVKG